MVLAEREQDVLAAFITTNITTLNSDEVLLETNAVNKLKQDSKLN